MVETILVFDIVVFLVILILNLVMPKKNSISVVYIFFFWSCISFYENLSSEKYCHYTFLFYNTFYFFRLE